jgi:chromatin remodeling complex protein RSC6
MSAKVTIGNVYSCKIDNTMIPVRIDAKRETSENSYRGTNMITDAAIRVSGDALKGSGMPEKEFIERAAKAAKSADADAKNERAEEQKTSAAKTKKAAKKNASHAAVAKTKKTPKAPKAPAGPRPSLVNAAILILGGAKKPMSPGDILAAILDRKLWATGSGATPASTLSAAMLTDKRGRFNRADRGVWELTDAGRELIPAIKKVFAE